MNIASLGADSAVPGVYRNAVCVKNWVVPDFDVFQKYWYLVKTKVKKLKDLKQQNTILSSLRDTLLPKLLSGEIRIPEAEKLVEGLR
jgi:type I restriction enzyme S subunit